MTQEIVESWYEPISKRTHRLRITRTGEIVMEAFRPNGPNRYDWFDCQAPDSHLPLFQTASKRRKTA